MKTINFLYIDDNPESALGQYLDAYYKNSEFEIVYEEITFIPSKDNYDSLLQDSRVKLANVILIDSKLFENKTALVGKFSGEEFKLVLKKMYPYIEVIIVTQNDVEEGIDMIPKYSDMGFITSNEYYEEKLAPVLDNSINNIKQYWILADKMRENDIWESIIKEKILGSLQGLETYDLLTKTDIDNLIVEFKKIQESIDG